MKHIYWVYSYLIGYLSMQLHEVLHLIVARLFGFEGMLAAYSYSMSASGQPWQFAAISAAGTLSTIIYQNAGLIMFRSRDLFLKRTGFVLIFLNTVGRVLYEFSEFVVGAPVDETQVAQQLGISALWTRLPVTLFCILVLVYILVQDRQTGMKTVGWALSLTSSFIAVIITVLALGAMINALMRNGNVVLEANVLGYPLYLLLINAAMLVGLLFLIRNRQKYLALPSG